jgi:chromosomal replication initiation ATPase DnaA
MTPVRPQQLVLELPHRQALAREDFLVTDANRAAVAMIDLWPNWPAHGVILCGPSGSGKTHLAEVWRKVSGAQRILAKELRKEDLPLLLSTGALVVESAGQGAVDERAFFHLLNLTRQSAAHVLLTALQPPATWDIRLSDLRSRLLALPVIELGPPDDALLRGVIVKLFGDRQLAVDEAVLSYALLRMPRSLAAAWALVAEIDRRALEEKQEISRSFVARILAEFDSPELFDSED